jgi:hypothetical protein
MNMSKTPHRENDEAKRAHGKTAQERAGPERTSEEAQKGLHRSKVSGGGGEQDRHHTHDPRAK